MKCKRCKDEFTPNLRGQNVCCDCITSGRSTDGNDDSRAIAAEDMLRAVIESFDQEGCSNDLGVVSANVVNRCCILLGRDRVTPNDHGGIILEDGEVLTWWRCPDCHKETGVPAEELATIGTPHCIECEGRETEMEPIDAPIF